MQALNFSRQKALSILHPLMCQIGQNLFQHLKLHKVENTADLFLEAVSSTATNYKTFVWQKNDYYLWVCFILLYFKATMAQKVLKSFPYTKIMVLNHTEVPVQNTKNNLFL